MIKFPEVKTPKEGDVYLILKLVINGAETDYDKAVAWEPIGYVNTEEEAVKSIIDGGFTFGNGWPLQKDSKNASRIFIRIPKI
jgi:hypothetical protein